MSRPTPTTTDDWYPWNPADIPLPGDTLRETLDALDMTQARLAQRTGLSGKHINQIIKGQSAITHEMAIALERATGVPARFWNALEAQYRDYRVRSDEKTELTARADWLHTIPQPAIAALRKLGHVSATAKDPGALLQQVLAFFGVRSIEAWESVWAKPSAAFLQSPAFEAHQGAVAVWLRLGELEAVNLHCEPFQRGALKQLLPQLRALTRVPAPEFCHELQDHCASVGVAVVYVPEVAGARSSGATRWLSPTKAIVQLSDRGKKSDRFWFAFFHEIGHVLLHGKRDIFVDDEKIGDDAESDQEREASDFARDLLIPASYGLDLAAAQTKADVGTLADRVGVSPAIVAGRIRHDRKDFAFCNGVNETFDITLISDRATGAQIPNRHRRG